MAKKEFVVEVYELHAEKHAVMAEDRIDAIERINAGEGDIVDNSLEYIETASDYGISIEEMAFSDEEIERMEKNGAADFNGGYVPGIRSVEEA